MSSSYEEGEWFTCGECGQQLGDITKWPEHACFKKVANQDDYDFLRNDYNQIFLHPKKGVEEVAENSCISDTSQGTEVVDAEEAKLNSLDESLEDRIIVSVRGRPTLWKPDQAKRFPAQALQEWENVCEDIGQPRSKRDVIKKMWFSLRSKYARARKTFAKPKPSGTAAKAKKSRFIFYDEMSFLADTIDVPETSSTLYASDSSNSQHNLPFEPDPPRVQIETNTKKTPRQEYEELCRLNRQVPLSIPEERKEDQILRKNSTMRQQMIELLKNNDTPKTPDGVDGFCAQAAEILRTIKDPLTRSEIQTALLNFLHTKVREAGEYRI